MGEYTNDIEREIFPIWFEEDPYTKAADEYAIGGMKNAGDAYSDGSKTLYYDTIVDVYTDLQNEKTANFIRVITMTEAFPSASKTTIPT